jgi:DNA-binding MarR family transcriptional regulator
MSKDTELLTEIRDLLAVMAEPLMEKRHKKFRDGIRAVVGKKQAGRAAVLLMDGTRTQAAIAKESKMDPAALTRLLKQLKGKALCEVEGKHPKLAGKLPGDFWDQNGESDE